MTIKGPDGFPKQGKGRGKPLPREGGKRGLMGFWIRVPLTHLSPRGLVGLQISNVGYFGKAYYRNIKVSKK